MLDVFSEPALLQVVLDVEDPGVAVFEPVEHGLDFVFLDLGRGGCWFIDFRRSDCVDGCVWLHYLGEKIHHSRADGREFLGIETLNLV